MNSIADFFKELKDRVSNPFWTSFVISWLVFNWKIPIGLIFYKGELLRVDGYISFIDLIERNLEIKKAFIYPLIGALAYTFIFPFFLNAIGAFQSWTKSWGSSWSLRLSKGGKISVSKYIELRDIYKQRTKLVEDVLANESKYLQDYEELKNSSLIVTEERNKIRIDLQEWKNYNTSNFLDGEWEFSFKATLTGQLTVNKVHFSSGLLQWLDKDGSSYGQKDRVADFFGNPIAGRLSFFIVSVEGADSKARRDVYKHHVLQVLDDGSVLKGKEDNTVDIQYRRTSKRS